MSNSTRPVLSRANLDRPPQSSSWLEITLVLGGPLLVFTLTQSLTFFSAENLKITDGQLGLLVAFETVFGFLLVTYLHRHGWRLSTVSLPAAGRDVLRGLGVWVIGYIVCIAVLLPAWFIFPGQVMAIANTQFRGTLTLPFIVVVSAINPIFEEGLWLGYIVNGPGRERRATTYVLSIGSRVLVHAYQGWQALFTIAPLGVWFLMYYLRNRRLVPVLLAHGIYDLMGLSLLRYFSASD